MTRNQKVNQSELAGILGVTIETIREWRRNGLPFSYNDKLTRVEFDVSAVKRWRAQRAAKKRSDPIMDALKARKLGLQNRLREIQLDLASGKLVGRAQAVHECQQKISNARSRMLAMGTKLSPYILGRSKDEIRDLIDGECFEILKEMCESPASLRHR